MCCADKQKENGVGTRIVGFHTVGAPVRAANNHTVLPRRTHSNTHPEHPLGYLEAALNERFREIRCCNSAFLFQRCICVALLLKGFFFSNVYTTGNSLFPKHGENNFPQICHFAFAMGNAVSVPSTVSSIPKRTERLCGDR